MLSSLRLNIAVLWACLMFLTGCFGNLDYKLYDEYKLVSPKTVYLAPIEWTAPDSKSKDIATEFLSSLIKEKLEKLGYTTTDSMDGADVYLHTTVTHWKEKLFPTYGALKIGFIFQMTSAKELPESAKTPVLWKAEFKSKDFDIRLDTEQMEMGIIKAFEPRLERAVDTSFSTLPEVKFIKEEKKFFDWLP